jgi:hypothetical protein
VKTIACVCVSAVMAFATPAIAHHSYAMFDAEKTVALTGTVQELRWSNPHVLLVLVTQDPQDKKVEWELEGPSPTVFRVRGWPRSFAKVGDNITIQMHPLRNGANGGALESVMTVDGKTYSITLPPLSTPTDSAAKSPQ